MSFAWLGKKARADNGADSDAERAEAGGRGNGHAKAAGGDGYAARGGDDDGDDTFDRHAAGRKFSVHVTHVPFSATQHDLSEFFKAHDCAVDDIRMVRKTGRDGERVFTGVAFVDFMDAESHAKALSLHQSKLWPGSLKINIRPTLDKTALAAVAAGRTNQVQTKKQAQVGRKLQKLTALGLDAEDVAPPELAAPAADGPAKRKHPLHPAGGKKKKKKKKLGRKERMRQREQQQQKQARREAAGGAGAGAAHTGGAN